MTKNDKSSIKNNQKKKKNNNKKKESENYSSIVSFVIFFKKSFRIFKIIFNVSLIFLFFITIFLFYKYKIFSTTVKKIRIFYSDLLYQDICSNIELNGVENANIDNINSYINDYCISQDKINMNNLLLSIKQDSWIKNVRIKRQIPNTIKIYIEEYNPFVIYKQKNNDFILLDENSNIIDVSESDKKKYRNLLIISGEGSEKNIKNLFNIFTSNPQLFSRIKRAVRIENRRWNLFLENGILIKMPENDFLNAWKKLESILSVKGIEINLKYIDLRNKDKIYIENNE